MLHFFPLNLVEEKGNHGNMSGVYHPLSTKTITSSIPYHILLLFILIALSLHISSNIFVDNTSSPWLSSTVAISGKYYGIWYMVYGIWYMVYGIWYMVYGICIALSISICITQKDFQVLS